MAELDQAVSVRPARGDDEVRSALELRRRVFCDEQGVSLESEQDGRDHGALHLVAIEGGELLGTCRLILAGRTATLSRMAVDASARGRGVGRAVLEEAERQAVAAGARRIRLHAQLRALDFYERSGFRTRGRVFVEEGIDHVAMEKLVA